MTTAGPAGTAPLARCPGDGRAVLVLVARALAEGAVGGVALALLGGAVLAGVNGRNPFGTFLSLPLSGPVGLVLGLLGAATALLVLWLEVVLVRRRGIRTTPLRLAVAPAATVAVLGGTAVYLLLHGLDGAEALPLSVVLAAVATLGGGGLVLWRGPVLLRDPGRR